MPLFWIVFWGVIFITLITLIIAYICYKEIFFSPKRGKPERYPLPKGEPYEKYHTRMIDLLKRVDKMPHKNVSIKSFDGLTLRGKYFEYTKDAPIEIMFHGYKGSARRDMSGGVIRAHAVGHSALIVDHRASGKSDGHIISFGVNEGRDCMSWIDFVIKKINKDARIILTGVSMGAATVMICAAEPLPKNVIGVLADCGYTAPEDIIKKVMRDMHLPADLLYPFARLGARLFGGFKLDSKKPIDAMARCKLPIIFYHGDNDDYVPYDMSMLNFDACASKYKQFVDIEGAGHGLCFLTDEEKYIRTLKEFFRPIENP